MAGSRSTILIRESDRLSSYQELEKAKIDGGFVEREDAGYGIAEPRQIEVKNILLDFSSSDVSLRAYD